jgi:hypothetical protein
MVLTKEHEGIDGGNYAINPTTKKELHAGLWWPIVHKDAKEYCQNCDVYQRVGKPSRRDEMPLMPQVTLQVFLNGLWISLDPLIHQQGDKDPDTSVVPESVLKAIKY